MIASCRPIKKNVKFAAHFVVLSMASTTLFSAELPNNTDLKAVYCLTVSNGSFKSIALAESMVPMLPLDKQEAIKKDTAKRRDNLKRLQSYIFPRLKFLELEGLMVAERRAEQDVADGTREMLACVTGCTDERCTDKCMDSPSEAALRVRSCNDTFWLPF